MPNNWIKEEKSKKAVKFTLTASPMFLSKMKSKAEARGMSLSGYIRFAVSELEKGE